MRLFWSKIINHFYVIGQTWRLTWRDIWHEPANRWLIIFTLIFLIGNWLLAELLASIAGNGLLILHYNIHFGIDLIGQPASIYWLPAGATVAIIINSFLPLIRCQASRQVRLIVLFGSLSVMIAVSLALTGLLLINFR
jgi:hypothetical protein